MFALVGWAKIDSRVRWCERFMDMMVPETGTEHNAACFREYVIDLAKNVFALHGVGDTGKPALVRTSVPRGTLLAMVAVLPPRLIGMEACSGAHHWARLFQSHGHTVRLMAPKFVAPYRLSGKKGKNDAAGEQLRV